MFQLQGRGTFTDLSGSMYMRYYFHLRDEESLLSDIEGEEHKDASSALRAAEAAARDMLAECIVKDEVIDHQAVVVEDAHGRRVGEIFFRSLIKL